MGAPERPRDFPNGTNALVSGDTIATRSRGSLVVLSALIAGCAEFCCFLEPAHIAKACRAGRVGGRHAVGRAG